MSNAASISRFPVPDIDAFFGLSNRMANAIPMRPNAAFFLMGRVPRNQ